jgi:hypothetical protein
MRRDCFAGIHLLAGLIAAAAAPNIPPSEMPGRERGRFQEQPLDRFMQPGAPQKAQPLWQWQCDEPKGRRKKNAGKRRKDC